MATRLRKGARTHLYITEWMEHRTISDERLGNRLGVGRETVWRWRNEQHRLNPEKIAALASALDCEPQDLWRLPGSQSLDSIVQNAPEDLRATAADIVRRLVSRAS